MKNYIGYVNDHSGSMGSLAVAAAKDYNANITAVKDAASREMLDTVVSVVGVGLQDDRRCGFARQLTVSNPHVLKAITNWPTPGGTPLWDAIYDMIELHEGLPDINKPDVSVLIVITSDGRDEYSRLRTKEELARKIAEKQATGRWTFVVRIPTALRRYVNDLNIPHDNIQSWDTTDAGMEASSVATTQAMSNYFTTRAAGAKSTNVFYSSTANVDTSKLVDIKDKTSLYVVPGYQDGIMVRDFILTKRTEYLIGAAFYQLVKTEARVQPNKLLLIRDKKTGAVYAGTEARTMLGLDTFNNARVHPNHGNGNYDIFIQSTSVNRKLPAGSGVLYWAEKGRAVTAEDMQFLLPKAPAAPAVPTLMSAPATGKPTPSPIQKQVSAKPIATPVTPVKKSPVVPLYRGQVDGKPVLWFKERDTARLFHKTQKSATTDRDGKKYGAFGPNGERWFVFV